MEASLAVTDSSADPTGIRRPSAIDSRFNPNQRSDWQSLKERNQIVRSQVNAPPGCGTAECSFIAGAMDVNVTRVRVHVAAAIETGFEALQPQDARGDLCVGHALPREADRFPVLEHSPHWPTPTDFSRYPVKAKGRAV